MTIPNRRTHIRAPLSLEVVVEGNSGRREARTSDISLGGCYVDAMHRAAHGEAVRLRVLLPRGEWIEISGEVIYEQWPTGFGVRFVEMSNEARQSLDAAISEYLGQHVRKQTQLVA